MHENEKTLLPAHISDKASKVCRFISCVDKIQKAVGHLCTLETIRSLPEMYILFNYIVLDRKISFSSLFVHAVFLLGSNNSKDLFSHFKI